MNRSDTHQAISYQTSHQAINTERDMTTKLKTPTSEELCMIGHAAHRIADRASVAFWMGHENGGHAPYHLNELRDAFTRMCELFGVEIPTDEVAK